MEVSGCPDVDTETCIADFRGETIFVLGHDYKVKCSVLILIRGVLISGRMLG